MWPGTVNGSSLEAGGYTETWTLTLVYHISDDYTYARFSTFAFIGCTTLLFDGILQKDTNMTVALANVDSNPLSCLGLGWWLWG